MTPDNSGSVESGETLARQLATLNLKTDDYSSVRRDRWNNWWRKATGGSSGDGDNNTCKRSAKQFDWEEYLKFATEYKKERPDFFPPHHRKNAGNN